MSRETLSVLCPRVRYWSCWDPQVGLSTILIFCVSPYPLPFLPCADCLGELMHQTCLLKPARDGIKVWIASDICVHCRGLQWAFQGSLLLTSSVLSNFNVDSFSSSTSFCARQAEHHECHCQPQPVCHFSMWCWWLSWANHDVDKVRCCVQCPDCVWARMFSPRAGKRGWRESNILTGIRLSHFSHKRKNGLIMELQLASVVG